MDLIIVLFLILLNGFFSSSEMAVISTKKSRLEAEEKKGDKKAVKALKLANNPDSFLSTIQIGITTISILTGYFSGNKISGGLEVLLINIPYISKYAHSISIIFVVIIITFITLIFGELVPKRLGMSNPEKFAKRIAGLMILFSKISSPIVNLLASTTRYLTKLLHIENNSSKGVSEDEIKAILQQGKEVGEIEEYEQDIVERVFDLNDRDVSSIMTQRNEIHWIDLNDTNEEITTFIRENVHTTYPIAKEQIDNIKGVVILKDIFKDYNTKQFDVRKYIKPAQFIPESMSCSKVLELFKKTQQFYGIVTDEFGNIQGIVTVNDLTEALVGNITKPDEQDEQIIKRKDGSFLVDGQYSFYDFLAYFDMEDLYPENEYSTISGLILDLLERIPKESEIIDWNKFSIEIIDMDGARIDKLLVNLKEEEQEDDEEN